MKVSEIIALLDAKKAEHIEQIDLAGSDYFTDCVVVANVINEKQSLALLDELKAAIKAAGEEVYCVEASDEWIVIDSSVALVHLMSPNYREKYQIEQFLAEFKR